MQLPVCSWVSHLRNLHRQQRCLGSCWKRSTAGPPRPRGQNLHLPASQGPGPLPSTECGRPAGSGSLILLSGFMGIVYGTNPLMVNVRFLLKTCVPHHSTVPQQMFLCVGASQCFTQLPPYTFSVCVCAKSLQPCLTLCHPIVCSPPGSSVHGTLQARTRGWVAFSYSRRSSQPRNQTRIS